MENIMFGKLVYMEKSMAGIFKEIIYREKYLCKMIKILKNGFFLMMMINLIGNLNYLIWSLFERNVLKIKDLNCCLC